MIRRSRKNFWGGYNTYDIFGNLISQSVKNHLNGETIYEGDKKTYTSARSYVGEKTSYSEPTIYRPSKIDTGKMTFHSKEFSAPKRNHNSELNKEENINVKNILPKRTADVNIELFGSVLEGREHYQIPAEHVKIIAYQYKTMKEFPALCYLQEDTIYAAPLMKGCEKFSFSKNYTK